MAAFQSLSWDVMLHLTFARQPTHQGAIVMGRDWVNGTWGSLWPCESPVAAIFSEGGGTRRVHLHGVLKLPLSGVIPDEIERLASGFSRAWPHGRNRIEPYDRDRYGASYTAKHFGQDLTEFWVSSDAQRMLRRRWRGEHPGLRLGRPE